VVGNITLILLISTFFYIFAVLNPSSVKVGMGTIKKLTLENMSIAFGILSLGGTETEIHIGDNYPPPIATYVLK